MNAHTHTHQGPFWSKTTTAVFFLNLIIIFDGRQPPRSRSNKLNAWENRFLCRSLKVRWVWNVTAGPGIASHVHTQNRQEREREYYFTPPIISFFFHCSSMADALPPRKKTDRNNIIIIKKKKNFSSHGFFCFPKREGRVVTLSQRAKALSCSRANHN